MTLFDLPKLPERHTSAGRRRTQRQRAMLDGGYHPVTRFKLAANGETCGTCDQLRAQGGTAGTYYKCALNLTRGPATDTRLSWPACEAWEVQT